MRIAYVSVSDQLGGSETALLQMIAALRVARPSWTLHVILPGEGPLLPRVVDAGASCDVVPLPPGLARIGESAAVNDGWSGRAALSLAWQLCAGAGAAPGYERALRAALDDFAPDVIHTNGFKAHVFGARVRKAGERLVWHLHEYVGKRRLTRMLLRAQSPRCDGIVANSRSVAADIRAALSDRVPVPVHPIHNAVDLEVFTPEGPRLDLDAFAGLKPARPDVVRAGLVATFSRWKGHDVFVRALQHASARAPQLRGYIVGDALYDTAGSQHSRDAVRGMVHAAGLDDRCGLTGFLDPASAMRSLDIVIHASTEAEPFGLVIAEAMACGRAVITTAQGGAAELIEAGVDALAVAPHDADALADAMLRLTADRAYRDEIARCARASALRRFPLARLASELVTVYESLVPAAVPSTERSA